MHAITSRSAFFNMPATIFHILMDSLSHAVDMADTGPMLVDGRAACSALTHLPTGATTMFELLPSGFLFGVIDNGIVAGGMLTTALLAIRFLPKEKRLAALKFALLATLTATLWNTASDFAGCVGDPTMWNDIGGITGGCLSISAICLFPITLLARVRAA
jgi:hypothetical protein